MNTHYSENVDIHKKRGLGQIGIPIAIIGAAICIGAAIYFASIETPTKLQNTSDISNVTIVPISADDHIRGNPNAPIVLIEYADFDCPFCKRFHHTMERVFEEYGPSGNVAWVYRHLPIVSLHPNALYLARASECVAKQTGNDGFWTFADQIFAGRGLNEQTDLSQLPTYAQKAGADVSKFKTCITSDAFTDTIQAGIKEAVAANGGLEKLGTPFTIVMVEGEYIGKIAGAQTYDMVTQNIDAILAQLRTHTEKNK